MNLEEKRILVTGAPGFIGSHLTHRLIQEGAEVSIMTIYNSIIENVRLEDVWDKINIIEADLRNVDSLKQVKKLEPEIIFHLAAYNQVGTSFRDVNEVFDVNAKGTANLIESYDGFECFVYTSTSEIYGLQDSVPFKEEMQPKPISPYAITKYAGELYCRMKQHINKQNIVILRPFNVFGPFQSTRAIIPEIILNCLKGKEIKSTEGKQTREFNYVDDIIDGFILAAKNKAAIGKIINIGNGKEIAIRDLILKIAELTNTNSKLSIGALHYRPTEIWRMCAANEKAREILGWQSKTSFEDGLKKTIEWYKKSKYAKKI